MTPEVALIELLGSVSARVGETVTVSTEELSLWSAAAASALKSQGLLLKARPAKSVVSPGCEQECSMPVHTVTRPNATVATSFVVCDKRSDINRVSIHGARLAQGAVMPKRCAGFLPPVLVWCKPPYNLLMSVCCPLAWREVTSAPRCCACTSTGIWRW